MSVKRYTLVRFLLLSTIVFSVAFTPANASKAVEPATSDRVVLYTPPSQVPAQFTTDRFTTEITTYTSEGMKKYTVAELERNIELTLSDQSLQNGVESSLNDCICVYSGYLVTPQAGDPKVEAHMLFLVRTLLNFELLTPVNRQALLAGVVKSGSLELVKVCIEKMLALDRRELENHCQILKLSPDSFEVPIFWLPAVCSRWNESKVPDQAYVEIENYLCNLLCPQGTAILYGKLVTRDEFVRNVNVWKVAQNKKLGRNRHQLPLAFLKETE